MKIEFGKRAAKTIRTVAELAHDVAVRHVDAQVRCAEAMSRYLLGVIDTLERLAIQERPKTSPRCCAASGAA